MPKGVFRPVAKTCTSLGFPSGVMPRKILMSPAVVSARNISPLGALRRIRGLVSPVAYRPTVKPSGALGHAFSGRGTTVGPPTADFDAYGAGRSLSVMWRIVPGFS